MCLLCLQCKNKVSLQNLSMVLRQLRTDTGDEHSRHVMDSVRQAKLAVQMDVHDGRSWCECSQKKKISKFLEQWFSVGLHSRIIWSPTVESGSKYLCFEEAERCFDEPLF